MASDLASGGLSHFTLFCSETQYRPFSFSGFQVTPCSRPKPSLQPHGPHLLHAHTKPSHKHFPQTHPSLPYFACGAPSPRNACLVPTLPFKTHSHSSEIDSKFLKKLQIHDKDAIRSKRGVGLEEVRKDFNSVYHLYRSSKDFKGLNGTKCKI